MQVKQDDIPVVPVSERGPGLWLMIDEAAQETGIRADELLESFKRCGIRVGRVPVGDGPGAFGFPHVEMAGYLRWKKLAAWRSETRWRVSAVPWSLDLADAVGEAGGQPARSG